MLRAIAALLLPFAAGAQAPAPAPPGRIAGLVVDAFQQPQPAAEVWLEASGVVVARTHSDATGWFAFPPQPRQAHVVHARQAGRAAGAVALSSFGSGSEFARVTLLPVRAVRGTVRAPGGAPVAGAWVVAMPEDEPLLAVVTARATSAADGSYVLGEVLPGPARLWAWAPGCAMAEDRALGNEDAQVDLQLDKLDDSARQLTLCLDGATPEQIRGAVFACHAEYAHVPVPLPAAFTSIRADGHGVAVVTGLGDKLRFAVDRVEVPHALLAVECADSVGPGESRWALRLPVRSHGAIRGRVQDPKGQPLAGVHLGCWPLGDDRDDAFRFLQYAGASGPAVWSVTDAQGRFEFASPVAGGERFALRIVDDTWLATTRDPDLPGCWVGVHNGEGLQVRAMRGERRRVQLVDAGGRPQVGLGVVALSSADVERGYWLGEGMTDADGVADLPPLDLAAGDASVLAIHAGVLLPPVPMPPAGANGAPVQLVRPELSAIEGRVLDAAGAPVFGARVRVRFSSSGAAAGTSWLRLGWAETISDADGRYRLAGMPQCKCLIVAARPLGPPSLVPVEVTAGGVTSQELRVE